MLLIINNNAVDGHGEVVAAAAERAVQRRDVTIRLPAPFRCITLTSSN